jgi:hypothetical protein
MWGGLPHHLLPDFLKFPKRCFEAFEKQQLFSMRRLVPNLQHLSLHVFVAFRKPLRGDPA